MTSSTATGVEERATGMMRRLDGLHQAWLDDYNPDADGEYISAIGDLLREWQAALTPDAAEQTGGAE